MIQERAREGESAREEIARLRKELQEALARGRQREEMDVEEGFIEENGLGIDFEIVGGNKRKNVDNPGKLVVEYLNPTLIIADEICMTLYVF